MSKWYLNFFMLLIVAPVALAVGVNCNQYKDANWIKECQQLQNDLNKKQAIEINSFDKDLKQDHAELLKTTPAPVTSLPPLIRTKPATPQEQEQLKQEMQPEHAQQPVKQDRIKIFY